MDGATGSKRALSWIAVIGLVVPAFLALNLWFEWFGDSTSEAVVYGTFTADRFALFFQFLIIGATGVVILASGAISATVQGFPRRVLHIAADSQRLG